MEDPFDEIYENRCFFQRAIQRAIIRPIPLFQSKVIAVFHFNTLDLGSTSKVD